MIYLTILFLLFCDADARDQAKHFKAGGIVDHDKKAIPVLLIAIALSAFLFVFTKHGIFLFAFLLPLRWLAFDLLLNKYRRFQWSYQGTITVHSAKLDIFLYKHKITKYKMLTLKLVCIAVGFFIQYSSPI